MRDVYDLFNDFTDQGWNLETMAILMANFITQQSLVPRFRDHLQDVVNEEDAETSKLTDTEQEDLNLLVLENPATRLLSGPAPVRESLAQQDCPDCGQLGFTSYRDDARRSEKMRWCRGAEVFSRSCQVEVTWDQMKQDWVDGDAINAMYDDEAGMLVREEDQIEECWSIYNEFLRPQGQPYGP